jgi:hypothetical protein
MSAAKAIRFSHPPSTEERAPALRACPADLLLMEGAGLAPRHQRILIAGFALDATDNYSGGRAAMKRALELYHRIDPFGIDAPSCFDGSALTVGNILVELDGIVRAAR